MNGIADRWIRRTTIGCVALLAVIAGTVSYLHMHLLVVLDGQPGWVAALTPLSVDGMIVAASTTLLAESRAGRRGGFLPWAMLVVGSVASLAANVAVAQPTAVGRIVAAWPSFGLIGSYELLMRCIRVSAAEGRVQSPAGGPSGTEGHRSARGMHRHLQRQAWQWAQDNPDSEGSLPSGRQIASQFGRHERWGRLVKKSGLAGELSTRIGVSPG